MRSSLLDQALGAYHEFRRQGRAAPAFSPDQIGKPELWIDPSDTSRMTFEMAALFGSGASGAYLSTADHADFNFNSGQVFTVEFWRNNTGRQDVSNGLDRGFVGQYNFNVDGSWAVASGGSVNQGTSIRVMMATNASGSTSAVATTPANGPDWSHCVVVYDGTQATPANRVLIYRDGVLVDPGTYVITGTLPANPNNSAAALTIGRILNVWNLADAAINRVRLWNAKLLPSSVTELWNNGAGHYHATLPTALKDLSLVLSCDCTEGPGETRVDQAEGHNLAEAGGTVSQAALVMELRDKGAAGLVFRPLVAGGAPPFGLGFAGAPRWHAAALGGRPCLRFHDKHGLRAAATQAFNFDTCDCIEAWQWNAFANSESFQLVSADEGSAVAYAFTGETTDGADHKPWFRFRDNNSPNNFNTNVKAEALLTAGQRYVSSWRALGTGRGADSFRHRLNGVQSALTYANADVNEKSFDDVKGRDNVTIGTLVRSDGVQTGIGKDLLLGESLIYAPGLTSELNRLIEHYVALGAGIALA